MDILVTGFKPFLGEAINPSEKLAVALSEVAEVRSIILPVEFNNSFEILKSEVSNRTPDFLIMIGQAGGRKNICFEKVGLNWLQTEHPDENGFAPQPGAILKDAPLALMSSFPIDSIYHELKQQSEPVEISFSAGTYVCNDLYFRTLSEFSTLKSVFMHVPCLPEQAKAGEQKPTIEFASQLKVFKYVISQLNFLMS